LSKGIHPIDLLSGLGDIASKLPICRHEATRFTVGCTITAVGAIVHRLAGLRDAFNQPWSDKTACEQIKLFGSDETFKRFFETELFDGKPPKNLSDFFELAPNLDCTSPPTNESYVEIMKLGRSLFDLDALVKSTSRGNAAPLDVARQGIALVLDVIQSGAELLGNPDDPDLKRLVTATNALGDILRGNFADGIRQILAFIAEFPDAFPKSIRVYIVLIGDLAAAKAPADVQAALQAASAPVGSWRLKRQHEFTLTVTAVLGAQAGGEFPLEAPGGVKLQPGWAAGAMASIGLEAAWRCPNNFSAGIYLTVLDVGQLAWARITGTDQGDEATSQNHQTKADVQSDIGFLDVLSPGLFLKLGVGKSPFTIGLGASFAPKLRKYFYEQNGTSGNDLFTMMRVGIWVGIDLTLFPLYIHH
jgi:hypothetical protein